MIGDTEAFDFILLFWTDSAKVISHWYLDTWNILNTTITMVEFSEVTSVTLEAHHYNSLGGYAPGTFGHFGM